MDGRSNSPRSTTCASPVDALATVPPPAQAPSSPSKTTRLLFAPSSSEVAAHPCPVVALCTIGRRPSTLACRFQHLGLSSSPRSLLLSSSPTSTTPCVRQCSKSCCRFQQNPSPVVAMVSRGTPLQQNGASVPAWRGRRCSNCHGRF